MREDSLSLPKSLKANEVEDLWREKRKNYKFEMFASLPDLEGKKMETDSPKKSEYKESRINPFIQQRRIFKLPDYKNPIYQEPDYDANFRRTNFRISENRSSESRSRSRKASKL